MNRLPCIVAGTALLEGSLSSCRVKTGMKGTTKLNVMSM